MVAAVLRKASMIGSHKLQGMMESDPGFWLTIPRKGSISWSCRWRMKHDPELAVMTKQNFFLLQAQWGTVWERKQLLLKQAAREATPLEQRWDYAGNCKCTCLFKINISGIKEIFHF